MAQEVKRGLLHRDPQRHYTIVKRAWCKEAQDALQECFCAGDDGKQIVDGVMSERMELFKVNEDSWAVTERMGGMLFIWCYAGSGSRDFVERMILIARVNGMEQVSFFSYHKGAARMWRDYNPRMIPTGKPGEVQYCFEVKV